MFEKIENYYRENHLLKEDDLVKMMYAIRTVWNDLIKLTVMGLIAWLLRVFGIYLWVIAVFTSCRVFLGGLHKKSFWGCTVFTASQIFGIIYVGHLAVRLDMNLMWLAGASISIVLVIGSVVSSEKRKCTKEKMRWFKVVSFGIELFWMFVAWTQRENEMVQQGAEDNMKKVLMLLGGGGFSFCAVLIANTGTGILGGEEKLPDVLK